MHLGAAFSTNLGFKVVRRHFGWEERKSSSGASWHSAHPHTHSVEGDALGECVDEGEVCPGLTGRWDGATATSRLCAAAVKTPAVVAIMENDERYRGSFPREEDNHNILPACLQSGAVVRKGPIKPRYLSENIERKKETENAGALLHFFFYYINVKITKTCCRSGQHQSQTRWGADISSRGWMKSARSATELRLLQVKTHRSKNNWENEHWGEDLRVPPEHLLGLYTVKGTVLF